MDFETFDFTSRLILLSPIKLQMCGSPKVITVAPSGGDYTSIQAAINSNNNVTIIVEATTYEEEILIQNKCNIHLKSNGAILKPPSAGLSGNSIITIVDSKNITISHFVIAGPNTGNLVYGIFIASSTVCLFENTISDIRDEPVTDSEMFGIGVEGSFSKNGNSAKACTKVVIDGNIVTNYQRIGILVARSGGTVNSGKDIQFDIKNNTVSNQQNSTRITHGIQVSRQSKGTISNNLITGNSFTGKDSNSSGILVFLEEGICIKGNEARGDDFGITLLQSRGNRMVGNVTNKNVVDGILLRDDGNIVERNKSCGNGRLDYNDLGNGNIFYCNVGSKTNGIVQNIGDLKGFLPEYL